MMKHKLSNQFLNLIASTLLGQLVPALFISIDLYELDLPWTIQNAMDVYTSQRIYIFSTISVPLFLWSLIRLFKKTSEQKHYYHSILNELDKPLIVFDSSMKPVFLNEAAKDLSLFNKIDEVIALGMIQDNFEWYHQAHGETFYYLGSTTPLSQSDQKVLILKNITEFKRNQEIIKDQEQSIIRSGQLAALGEVAAGISHEINNPLAVIMGNLGILKSELSNSTDFVKARIDTIDRMSQRISGIVKGMKNLSRQSHTDDWQEVQLIGLIQDIQNLTSMNIKNKGIDLKIDMASFEGLQFKGSSVQMGQVLINLVINAAHALEEYQGEDDKWIQIKSYYQRDELKIIVSNSGPKIPKNIQEKIFNPFFTTKDPGKGTGLGLSLSKSIVELHRGQLTLDDSKPNTTFIISIPLKISEAA
jgi:signal transduction histidine kinase